MALTPQQELEVIALLAERAAAAGDLNDRALDRRAMASGEHTLTAPERTRLTAARARWASTQAASATARVLLAPARLGND